MKDWAIDYVLHVLQEKNWSANRLAKEVGLSSTTISRPLADPCYAGSLSRRTITKIFEKTGIDPAPFVPEQGVGKKQFYVSPPVPRRNKGNVHGGTLGSRKHESPLNHITLEFDGRTLRLEATLDRSGLEDLRRKLDAIESLMDA
ncbi:hypothetical protein [Roseicyclus sp.]|uniref:hypothetical protein n=1 Tax=Roseicyclus sp. TaxID=1914329 RepID=UPI003F6B7B28